MADWPAIEKHELDEMERNIRESHWFGVPELFRYEHMRLIEEVRRLRALQEEKK